METTLERESIMKTALANERGGVDPFSKTPIHIVVKISEEAWGALKNIAQEQYRHPEQQAGYLLDETIKLSTACPMTESKPSIFSGETSDPTMEKEQPENIDDETLDDETLDDATSIPDTVSGLDNIQARFANWVDANSADLVTPTEAESSAFFFLLGRYDFSRVVPTRFHSPKRGYLTGPQDRAVAYAALKLMGNKIEGRISCKEVSRMTGIGQSGCRNCMKRLVNIFRRVEVRGGIPDKKRGGLLYSIEDALRYLWADSEKRV